MIETSTKRTIVLHPKRDHTALVQDVTSHGKIIYPATGPAREKKKYVAEHRRSAFFAYIVLLGAFLDCNHLHQNPCLSLPNERFASSFKACIPRAALQSLGLPKLRLWHRPARPPPACNGCGSSKHSVLAYLHDTGRGKSARQGCCTHFNRNGVVDGWHLSFIY